MPPQCVCTHACTCIALSSVLDASPCPSLSSLPLNSQLSRILEEYLEDYTQVNTAQMKLVLFLDAVRHVCRIARIIRQPLGNALLLGVGGSGRQSLTRLAAHM